MPFVPKALSNCPFALDLTTNILEETVFPSIPTATILSSDCNITEDKLTKAVEILSATSAKLQYAGYEETFGVKFKREVRDLAIRDLEVLGKYDSSVAQANKAIFIPILKNYSRDTRLK